MWLFAWIFVFYVISGCGGSSIVCCGICSGCSVGGGRGSRSGSCSSGISRSGGSVRCSGGSVISSVFGVIWLIWCSWGLKLDGGLIW